MMDDLIPAAMTTWAAKDLPARLLAAQVAKLLNCTTEDVAVLVAAGRLRPLGRPNVNAVKFFSAVELFALLADREWLDDATKPLASSGSARMPNDMDWLPKHRPLLWTCLLKARIANSRESQVVSDGEEARNYFFARVKYAQRSPRNNPQIILLDC